MTTELAPLLKLDRETRIRLVEDLWDSIAAEDPAPGISDELFAELDARSHRMATDPASVSSWEMVKQQARDAFGR